MNDGKIAYLVLAHQDPSMLYQMALTIDYKSRMFIHLDKKSNKFDFLEFEWPSSVEFIEDRINVYWGGISVVRATICLIKAALNSEELFSHLVLLSGLDYPIQSPESFYNFLHSHRDCQFIRFCEIERMAPGLRRTEDYWFHEPLLPLPSKLEKKFRSLLGKIFSFFLPPKRVDNITLVFGSQWWALTPDCASYIVQLLEEKPDLLDFFSTAHAPDEIIFHTVVANSPYIEQTEGFLNNVRAPRELSNLHVIKIGKVFKTDDFSSLKESDKFFVRKLSSTSSRELIHLLNKKVLSI